MRKVFLLFLTLLLCQGAYQALAVDGETLVQKTCTRCHDLGRVRAALGIKDQAAWSATVARMLAKSKAPAVTHEEHGAIVDWLSSQKK